jgi:hypothetical protein
MRPTLYFSVALLVASPASAAELDVTCSQVFQRISRPLEVAFGDKSLVWADVMVLAAVSPSRSPRNPVLKMQPALLGPCVERRVTITATDCTG